MVQSFTLEAGAASFPASLGPLSPLIGREDELTALIASINERQARLIVLTGPGGVGKTRLAMQVAMEVADAFTDGAVFVPLAPVISPDLVLPAIARAVGIWGAGDQPIEERLRDALRGLDLVLILDNFEHVLSAAARVAEIVSECPRVTLLVTSRERLNLVDEQDVPVLPLPLPDECQSERAMSDVASVRLFATRARAAAPGFALTEENVATVAAICHRLDGLPLAIELAASWMRIFSSNALLTRLEQRLPMLVSGPRDRSPRQQSMRETIAWSYDLLTAEEQQCFRRLAVFAAGFTLEAAEAVANMPHGQRVVLTHLVTFVDRSLLQRVVHETDEPRFAMLETMREFGMEQLEIGGDEARARLTHAEYYLAFAERLEPELYGGRDVIRSLSALEREHANLRAALTWLEAVGEAERLLRLAAALFRFWLMRGFLNEGREWLERALRPPGTSPSLRARALTALALLAWPQHAQKQALDALGQAVNLVEGTTNLEGVAYARLAQAWIALDQGDLTRAARWAAESKDRYEQLGRRWAAGHATSCLARVTFARGDIRRAEAMYESLLVAMLDAGDDYGLATTRYSLGLLHAARREYAEALAWHADALRGYQALGERLWIAVCLEAMASVAGTLGQFEDAARLVGAATAIRTKIGLLTWFADRDALARTGEAAAAALGEPAYSAASAAGAAAPLDDIIAEAVRLTEREIAPASPSAPNETLGPAGPLTPRERDVLRLLAEGLSNPDIGQALSISHRTVASHVEGIFRKLEVDSRAAAAATAVRHNLV